MLVGYLTASCIVRYLDLTNLLENIYLYVHYRGKSSVPQHYEKVDEIGKFISSYQQPAIADSVPTHPVPAVSENTISR